MNVVRSVNVADWQLSNVLGTRRERLLETPTPEVLVDCVVQDACRAVNDGSLTLLWQDSEERLGYARLKGSVKFCAAALAGTMAEC